MKLKTFVAARIGIALTVILAFAPRVCAETNRYAGDLWKFVDAAKVRAAAAEITISNYPDCDEATVEQNMVRSYRTDGTGECQDEVFVKVLTEKGKRANRTLSFSFMLPYSRVEVIQLELLKPDGRVVPVDVTANSKESIDNNQMASNIYDPNLRVLRVNIPQLEIGDVIHSITRQPIERPYIPGHFAEQNVFEGRGYIRHIAYEIHAPVDLPLQRIVLRDEIPGTVQYTHAPGDDGSVVHHWEVTNVPRMFDEPDMPPYEMVLQRLLVSTLPHWQTVSKWYWDLSRPHLEATVPEMQKTVDALTAGLTNDMDRLKAVFYHVSKQIRYMGLTPEKDRPGFEPHDVKLTFEKKYGVCRDKAALLVSLLQQAGLKAYPVLISVGVKRDPDVPDPFFNHAIVGVELEQGKYVLMDPTDENTRELLPYYDCDQSYLVCRPEGDGLRISPIEPPQKNLMRVKTVGTLDAAGTLHARSELSFDGVNDDSYRNMFAQMKPDDQRRFFERNLKQSMPGARLNLFQLLPGDMLDMSSEVRAVIEFSVNGMTANGNGKSVVNVPWIGKRLGIVNFILGGAGLDKRKYPLQTYVACGLKEDISIQLDNGFAGAVSMPDCPPVSNECMEYRQLFDCTNRVLDCSRELDLKVVEFSPAQYAGLKRTLKGLEYDERKTPVLAMAGSAAVKPARSARAGEAVPVESDAVLLESHKEIVVTNAHSALHHIRYKKQILTYNGKKQEAELKLEFNPSCEAARIVRGIVISRTGERHEIAPGEINVMDAGWNASAKRYTGSKILVANLPGVDIGSTIEVELEVNTWDKPFLAGFESFQMQDELKRKLVTLTAPAGLPIQQRVTGRKGAIQSGSRAGELGRKTFQWQARDVKARPAESQLPPEWIYSAGVTYFIGDPKQYYKALLETMLDRSGKSVQAAALARQLTHSTTTPAQAIEAIRDHIARSIRLAGPSYADLPLNELSAADTTLADGYGHTADRAILYHAMLAGAGFKPEFVLASDLPPVEAIVDFAKSFPLPQRFQSPLVKVVAGGRTYYLNDTDQYARLGTTPHDGRLGFELPSGKCRVIKADKDCANKTDMTFALSMGDNGQTRMAVTRRYFGTGYNSKKRYFAELPPEERKRYFQQVVSSVTQGAQHVGELITRFDEYPGIEQFTVDIDNYGVVDGNYFYFDLPFRPALFPAGADQRVLPLFISQRTKSTVRTEIDLPPGFRHVIIAPSSGRLKAPDNAGMARITLRQDNGKCVLIHELDTAPAIIPARDYPAMLDVESMLGNKGSRVFLLEKGTEAAQGSES